jgi:hypothetical protein
MEIDKTSLVEKIFEQSFKIATARQRFQGRALWEWGNFVCETLMLASTVSTRNKIIRVIRTKKKKKEIKTSLKRGWRGWQGLVPAGSYQDWWLTLVILATWRLRSGRSQFKASLGKKKFTRPHLNH